MRRGDTGHLVLVKLQVGRRFKGLGDYFGRGYGSPGSMATFS